MIKKLLLGLLLLSSLAFSQDYRYTSTLFTNTIKTSDIVYGNAPFKTNWAVSTDEYATDNRDLVMDIYTPDGDTETKRPAIIFAHAGGFLNGNRNHDDMVKFCEDLAKKGYITATIDYRKGFNVISDVDVRGTRAVYRGIQDGRSAIRYLRANSVDYGIDPDKVYFAGSSAGAFIALHSIYMDDSEKPYDAGEINFGLFGMYSAPDLGPLDNGLHTMYNGTPDAVISLWGAIQTPDIVEATDTTPIFMAHGIADGTVPYDSGYPFGYPAMPTVYGSKQVNDKLDGFAFTNKEIYFVDGEDHEFYGTDNGTWNDPINAYWDVIFDKSVTFLWQQHKPDVDFIDTPTGLSVDFTDTSTGALAWWWDFGDGTTSTQQNPTHVYNTTGVYDVKLYIENDIKSWDEVTKSLTYTSLAIADVDELEFKIYPNPTNGILNITSKTPLDRITIYSVLGKEILNTATNLNTIDISNYASGLYIVKAFSNNTVAVQRIVKK